MGCGYVGAWRELGQEVPWVSDALIQYLNLLVKQERGEIRVDASLIPVLCEIIQRNRLKLQKLVLIQIFSFPPIHAIKIHLTSSTNDNYDHIWL